MLPVRSDTCGWHESVLPHATCREQQQESRFMVHRDEEGMGKAMLSSTASEATGEATDEPEGQRSLDKLCFERQAQVAKALANARRMEILYRLHTASQPVEAGQLLEQMGISKANLSQQMSVLISAGLVEALRDGNREGSRVRYRLTTPKIGEACGLLREALFERMECEGELARQRRR